ncbi:hypothetical protein P5673_019401 [Acropora cervicornis]|uniref:Uncharacterized protein n=1 Tax=Acropora cervicornis TaxID=6130 RepID=A0AAD9QBR6_ACRCE|nr:hypothetical protein P5673_019401 [Acropora cervicornis]
MYPVQACAVLSLFSTHYSSHLSFSFAISADEYSGRNKVLAHVEACGRPSLSLPALATVKGAGGRLRPVTNRRNRLRSIEVN